MQPQQSGQQGQDTAHRRLQKPQEQIGRQERTGQRNRQNSGLLLPKEEAAQSKSFTTVNMEQAQKDLLRAIEHPEQLLAEYLNAPECVGHTEERHGEVPQIALAPETVQIFQTLREYGRNPARLLREGTVISNPEQFLLADMAYAQVLSQHAETGQTPPHSEKKAEEPGQRAQEGEAARRSAPEAGGTQQIKRKPPGYPQGRQEDSQSPGAPQGRQEDREPPGAPQGRQEDRESPGAPQGRQEDREPPGAPQGRQGDREPPGAPQGRRQEDRESPGAPQGRRQEDRESPGAPQGRQEDRESPGAPQGRRQEDSESSGVPQGRQEEPWTDERDKRLVLVHRQFGNSLPEEEWEAIRGSIQQNQNLTGRSWNQTAQHQSQTGQSQSQSQTGQGWNQTGESRNQTGQNWNQTGQNWNQTGQNWNQTGQNWNQTGQNWSQTAQNQNQIGQNWNRTGQHQSQAGQREQFAGQLPDSGLTGMQQTTGQRMPDPAQLAQQIQRSVRQQLDTVTEQVYAKLEKKLESERKRRGYS